MRSYHPRHIHHHFLRNLHIPSAFLSVLFLAFFMTCGTFVFAAKNVYFHMTINPGVLAVNMVDSSFQPILHPEISV